MAKVVDQIPSSSGDGTTYPWRQWFDGQAWCLIKGEDFTTSTESFRNTATTTAGRYGKRLVTRVRGDQVYVQAFPVMS